MHGVIRFTTSKFDVTKERPNDINPIPGESLLLWLAEQARGEVEIPIPEPEDWGWYSDIRWKGRRYMLGASASDGEAGQREWVLQISKNRTVKERFLSTEKMSAGDECLQFFHQLLLREPSFARVEIEEP